MITVNTSQCLKIGKTISNFKVRDQFLSRPFIKIESNREDKLRAYFHAVAICHQTYSLKWPSLNIYGWDVIETVYVSLIQNNHPLLRKQVYKENKSHIENLLKSVFSEDGVAEHCEFEQTDERAALLIELEGWLDANYEGSYSRLIDSFSGKSSKYYKELANTRAFSDPLKKKTSFLIKLLLDAGLVFIDDQEKLIPIMDYHMQRVLLRTACVELDDELQQKLINKVLLDSDQEIREACVKAMHIIAMQTSYGVLSMNDFFWPHGRSCCNEKPVCKVKHCEKTPCSFSLLIEIPDAHNCIFESICPGATDRSYQHLWQPLVKTHYY